MVSFRTKSGKLISFKAKGEGKTQKTASQGGRGRTRMAKKKEKKNRSAKRQGVVSWLTNVAALSMVMANPVSRMLEASKQSGSLNYKLTFLASRLVKDYTGIALKSEDLSYAYFDPKAMLRGYGPIAGAIVFKKGMGYATKSIKIQSLIPRLGIRS